MKVLVCHEFYRQFGGEDQSFLDEVSMLRANGHRVVEFTRDFGDVDRRNRMDIAVRSVWNAAAYRELRSVLRRERPAILHCTNLFPLISPAAYKAAHDEGVAVVQALRNYRFVCPSATLMREGGVCESCLQRAFPWPAVQHGCYKKSRLGSAVVATMLGIHHLMGTWKQVDCFYTPSHFARRLFIRAGMRGEHIEVKPNSVIPDPGVGTGDGGYALFVGRLSAEKGISTLIDAWQDPNIGLPLHVVGDGSCRHLVEAAASRDARIVYLGELSHQEVLQQMRSATCLVMPSVWYETFGRIIVESYAAGTPVIASRLGAMEELIVHQETGLLFEAGSAAALSEAVRALCQRADLPEIRRRARRQFENKYSAEQSYHCLMRIYRRALDRHRRFHRAAAAYVPPPHRAAVYASDTASGLPE